MEAIVFYAHGGVEQLQIAELPTPKPGSGEVLVRVHAVSLNGFDPMILQGSTNLKTQFPMTPCGDIAGEVAEIGQGVDAATWRPGMRVSVHPHAHRNGLMMGETLPGGAAEFAVAPAAALVPMPDAVSYVDAAALPVAYGTAYRMMKERGRIVKGEKVLILGATGGVGAGCVQLGKAVGAEVIACGHGGWKQARLRGIGADAVIDTSKDDFLKVVHERYGKPRYLGGGGVDVVINYIGGDTWVPSLKALTKGGRLLTCGATAGYATDNDVRYIWSFELSIIGSNGWTLEDQAALLAMVASGDMKPVIHSVRPLAELPASMQELIDRNVFGKAVLTL